jgi:hypothetical protein
MTKISWLIKCKEINTVYPENYTKPIKPSAGKVRVTDAGLNTVAAGILRVKAFLGCNLILSLFLL